MERGDLPPNAHVSRHPCLQAKLSQLRSHTCNAKETKNLVHEISLIVGCEALAHGLTVESTDSGLTPLGYEYAVEKVVPAKMLLMPILRSGLGMLDALQSILPEPVPVHHLGLFREKSTMTAVEYYNNLPYHHQHTGSSGSAAEGSSEASGPSDLAILIDAVIATGATAGAAIDTLRDWGVKRIIMICVIASHVGLKRTAEIWPEGVEVWAGGMDEEVDAQGMIKPGLGDIGDRLFLALGK